MANSYSLLSTGNTFGDWIVTTNALVKENNDIGYNDYEKPSGTLYLKDSLLGLQVSKAAIIQGNFQVSGTGSSATIQRNLTVQSLGTTYLQNTEISLVASGNVTAPNVITTNVTASGNIFSSNVFVTKNVTTSNIVATGSVYVTTNVNASNVISTNVTASGNIFSSNSFVTSNVTTGNVVATGSVYVTSNVTTSNVVSSNVYVTSNITTSNIVATGSLYVTSNVNSGNLISTGIAYISGNVNASNVISTNVTASGNIFSSNSFVTSNVTTGNVVATGSVYVTSNVTTSNVVATGSVYVTTNINASNIVSTNVTTSGNVFSSNVFVTSNVTTGNVVATGSVYVTSNVTTSNVVATGSVFVTSNINASNVISTNVTASGNIFSSNSFVTSNITTSNVVATGSVYVTNNVTTSNVVATGSVYVTGNINASNVVSTNVTTSNVFVTSNITTGNIVATGSVYLGGNVTTSNVVATGSVYLAGNVTTSNVVATGSVYVTSNVTTSNVVATGNVWVTSNVQASNVVASKLHISGTTQLVGQANTTADLGVGGNLYVPNNLIMSQSPASATIYALTVGSGGLTVQGNFILSQPTIYNAPSFTLYGTAPITGGNFGSFEVNRLPGTNASIRWSETNKEWATANVISGTFYRILTDENASGSSSLNNSLTYATSYALANANNYLQSYNSTANTGLKSYGDATYFAKTGGTISGAVTISSGGLISTASPIGIASGGTNNNTFTSSQLLYFNGTSIASLPGATAYSGVGSSTAIPVITTDIYGRVTSLSTASISTTLGIAGTTGSGSVALASQTLTVTSSTPTITSVTASGQTITIASQTSGVAASTYGTSTAIPVLTIDTYGRVTSASTTGISTTITLAGGSGSGSVSGGGTLTINGGTAISTSVSSGTYTINNTGVTSFSTNLTGLTPQTSTTGSVVLAGTLGVASGGTGVTTSTGTGSVVLSASPTFTGTVSGISATMVGLGSVTNESKATMFTSPTFTGTVSGITKSMVGLSNVDNTADASKSVSYASTAGSANANDVYSWAKAATKPSYTKSEVGLSNVDNTADASKSVSYASTAGTAGNLTGTPNISVGTITATVAAGGFSSILTGTVAGATVATKIENLSSAVNSRSSLSVLCGSSNETAISLAANRYAEQTELIAEGSDFYIRATNRPMYICTNYSQIAVTINPDRSVNFTGTVNGITKSMVGLGNVDNTADASKSVSYASTAGTAGNITAYTINQNLGTTSTVTFSTVTSSAFYYSSDARLKTNITKLTNHWDILNNLRPVNFDWISTGKKSQGLLAQEVQNVLPEAVNTSSDGTLSIDSSGIIAHLIASVQDLKSEIEELKKKLEK